jgi:hypothetical protein
MDSHNVNSDVQAGFGQCCIFATLVVLDLLFKRELK